MAADKEIARHTRELVGEIGQGKASKARIEPTDRITHRMRGLSTSCYAEGVPSACTLSIILRPLLHTNSKEGALKASVALDRI